MALTLKSMILVTQSIDTLPLILTSGLTLWNSIVGVERRILRQGFSGAFRKGVPRVDPIAVDSRGRIFSYMGWSITDQQPSVVPTLVESQDDLQMSGILYLRDVIRLFMRTNGGAPPEMLSKMREFSDKSAYNETLTGGHYRLEYFPPAAGAANTYMISAVCQSYGDICIRSFFLDQNGEIHETSEPRQPRAEDPLIPDCEEDAQICRDIDWPVQ